MPAVYLKKNEEHRIKTGHLWVFSNEIESIDGSPDSGTIVEIYDSKKKLIGHGFYNKSSLIAVRLFSGKFDGSITSYLRTSVLDAYGSRKEAYPLRDSFRMCFSESDYIPGLIIDKYNKTFVLQVYSTGIEKNIDDITYVLTNELGAENIFTMNDFYFRKLEGLPEKDAIYKGDQIDEIISDGKIKYCIRFQMAQKTGFYFDQSDNREILSKYALNKSVLDCFCNQGGFGLHCAKEGALNLHFVDASEAQLNNVKSNAALNNIETDIEYTTSDAFDYFEACIKVDKKFDIVNIDPPAFAKNKKSIPAALKGYEKLNSLAMKCVKKGGLLASSSCSHHVDRDSFTEALIKASVKANVSLQQIYFGSASQDHPSIPAMPETSYLNFGIFRIY